jgi:regulatory protein
VRARPPLSLKARAIGWLAQREHSRVELRRKLLRRARLDAGARDAEGVSPEVDAPPIEAEVDALLDWLEAHNHLSPARFAESRVHVRSARYGNLRIHQELARHAVELDDDAAATLRATELERARAVWARKFGTSPPGDAAARARQMRFLAGRGFSADVIRRVVRDADPS